MKRFTILLLLIVLFATLFVGYFHPITALTQDLGRHLLVGEIIVKELHVPSTNLFTYTYPDFPFINHHWLSEVVFYFVHQVFGFFGLLVIATLLACSAYAFPLIYTLKQTKNHYLTTLSLGIVSLMCFPILFERTDIRPELFSFFFVSVFTLLLFAYRKHSSRLVFLLLPLQILWVNIHIYFIIGVGLIGLFFLDSLLTHKFSFKKKQTKTLLMLFIATAFCTIINPNGFQGALYPFSVFGNYGYSIEENQNIFFLQSLFNKPSLLFFEIYSVFLVCLLLLKLKQTRPIDWLLALTFIPLGIMAERNIPLLVLVSLIPCVRLLTILFEERLPKLSFAPLLMWLMPICIVGFSFITMQTQIEKRGFGYSLAPGAERGADFFLENNLSGPIFNNFDIGSYLEYRVYPKIKVFIDGRPEAYPQEFFKNTYIPMQQDADIFAATSDKYKFETIFFSHTDQTPWAEMFLKNIHANPKWRLVYLDDTVVIYLKDTPQNQRIIQKFAPSAVKRALQTNGQTLESLYKLAHFLSSSGMREEEKEIYKKILSLDNKNCPSLYNLSWYLTEEQNPEGAFYSNQYRSYCTN